MASQGGFVAGLKAVIAERGLIQKSLAKEAGVSSVNLSKVLNLKNGSTQAWRAKICRALKMTEEEIIAAGEPKTKQDPASAKAEIPTDYSDLDAVMKIISDTVSGAVRHAKKTTARLHFWQTVIEELPVPALVIGHDMVVLYQNRKSREWGRVTGVNLCNGCVSSNCDKKDCAVMEAVEKGIEVSRYKWTTEGYYKVHCSPFRNDGKQYYVVTATEIKTAGKSIMEYERMKAERKFLSLNPFELPEYYANEDRIVTYINKSFGNVLGVDHNTIRTTDDLFAILTDKLFSPKKILKLAAIARDEGAESYSPAKIQGSNETLHFFFKPHIEGNELRGVYVCIMDQDMYEFQQRRGAL